MATRGRFGAALLAVALLAAAALWPAAPVRAAAAAGQACVDEPADLPSPPPPRGGSDCPRLDSRLLQLSRAADPAGFAAGAGLDYRDGAVRAIVELDGTLELPTGYAGLVVIARTANLVEALVPIGQLCPLAREPGVLAIRPPAGSGPDSTAPSRRTERD